MPRRVSKLTRYRRLVRMRKVDHSLQRFGMMNASCTRYDVPHLGSYGLWAGNLDADVVVLMADGRSAAQYCAARGLPELRTNSQPLPHAAPTCTNAALLLLLRALGRDIGLPTAPRDAGVFIADAVPFLNLRKAHYHAACSAFDYCTRRYLMPLLDIIAPKVLITVGVMPTRAIVHCLQALPLQGSRLSLPDDQLLRTLQAPYAIRQGSCLLYPVFHPGRVGLKQRARGLPRNGAWQAMRDDWQRIGCGLSGSISPAMHTTD